MPHPRSCLLIFTIILALATSVLSTHAFSGTDDKNKVDSLGTICIKPTFTMEFIGRQVVELTMNAQNSNGDFVVWIESHPVEQSTYRVATKADSLKVTAVPTKIPYFGKFKLRQDKGPNLNLPDEQVEFDDLTVKLTSDPKMLTWPSVGGEVYYSNQISLVLSSEDSYHDLKIKCGRGWVPVKSGVEIKVNDSSRIQFTSSLGEIETTSDSIEIQSFDSKTKKTMVGSSENPHSTQALDTLTLKGVDGGELKYNIQSADQITLRTLPETLYVRNGVAKNLFRLDPLNLALSEGYVVVRYKALQPGCKDWNEGTEVVSVLERNGLSLDAGVLFGLSVSGALKGHPEVTLNAQNDHWQLFTSFVEFRYTSIAALESLKIADTGKIQNFFSPFTSGGGVFNADIGFLIHPWDEPYQWNIFSIVAGGGFRTFTQSGFSNVFDRPRGFAGLHFNIPAFNRHNLNDMLGHPSGYFELGWSYDEFWKTDSAGQHKFYEPRRIFFEGELNIAGQSSNAIPLHLYIEGDLPTEHFVGGLMELNFGITAGIDPKKVSDFLTGIVNIF